MGNDSVSPDHQSVVESIKQAGQVLRDIVLHLEKQPLFLFGIACMVLAIVAFVVTAFCEIPQQLLWFPYALLGFGFLLALLGAVRILKQRKWPTTVATDTNQVIERHTTDNVSSISQSGGITAKNVFLTQEQTNEKSLLPKSARLEISPIERMEGNCPHISVVVKNEERKAVFCRAESHGIYNSTGENIKRSISSYANHFSWSGGSDQGTKEIPANLDGIINLVKINKRGYGIVFLFDENPHSYWKDEGTYKLDLMIVGTVEEDLSRIEFVGQRVMVEFVYIKNETRSNSGEIINNSELKLLTWNLTNNS